MVGMRNHRGDTLIELLLAVTIFSLASVATLAIMNRGIAISQHSLEVTTVRQQIDAQAEMIRYLRDTNDPQWIALKSNTWLATDIMPLSMTSCPAATSVYTASRHGFFVTYTSLNFVINRADGAHYGAATTYAQIDYQNNKTQGVWVQIAKAEGAGQIPAYDVYIHACWDSVSSNVPATLGTIVRLYDAS